MDTRISRRGFLGLLGIGVGAAGLGDDRIETWPNWSQNTSTASGGISVRVACGQTIPVIAQADVLVVGSSLDGCFLAERAAPKGQTVLLASSDTSLPREIAIGLRPWVTASDLNSAPDDIKSFLLSCVKERADNEIILDMIKVTERLENRIIDAGAGLYYDLHPCGVKMAGKQTTAVIFGCKGGLVAIEAQTIVDCTPDARVAILAGAEVVKRESANDGVVVRYSMLCKNPPRDRVLTVQSIPELVDSQVVMHGDFAEFRVRLAPLKSPFYESLYGLEARWVAARAAAGLAKSGALESTTFVRGGDFVLADPTRRIVSRSTDRKLSLDACRPKGIDNLLVCSPAVDVEDGVAKTLVEPLREPSLAQVVAKALEENLCKAQPAEKSKVQLSCSSTSGKATKAQAQFTELSPIYRTDNEISIDGMQLPVVADCDVLVVGAGTSGMPAALVAAEKGANTIVVEKYGDVGGTHTIGGVCKYWFGRETNFVRRLDSNASAMMKQTGMPKCMGMLNSLMKSGAHVLTHCLTVGAVLEDRAVVGIVVVTPEGLQVIKARRVIDATGDGDIAARAGARTDYGVRRDAMTLWYSFARFQGTNPEAARHFDCVVDPRDAADMSRAMISSRRRGRGRGPDGFPQYYLTPRESRHIQGGYTVTVADILSARRFEDMVLICKSNFDIKGIADSDLFLSGYVEFDYKKNYSVQIPYRALQPAALENILVIGKAYSITHDALALARMQRDMMAMGGVAGLATYQSVRNNKSFSALDVKALQKELVELGVLSDADLQSVKGVKGNELPPLGEKELRRMIDQLADGKLALDGKVQILVRPEQSIPLLKEALSKEGNKGNQALAEALCFLGDKSGADVLLAELNRQLKARALPMNIFVKHPSPDHGLAQPISFLINSLGRLGDVRVIPHMTEVARRVKMNPNVSDMMFNYVFNVCYAAERLGDPACQEALTILAEKPGIRGSVLPRGTDPRKTESPRADRYAYLELCVGRALARCGSHHGYDTILGYLHDTRGFLARSAHDELVDLAGRDFIYDKNAWQSWLSSAEVGPKPYRDNVQTAKTTKANKPDAGDGK